jgi:hypothetical protein
VKATHKKGERDSTGHAHVKPRLENHIEPCILCRLQYSQGPGTNDTTVVLRYLRQSICYTVEQEHGVLLSLLWWSVVLSRPGPERESARATALASLRHLTLLHRGHLSVALADLEVRRAREGTATHQGDQHQHPRHRARGGY